MHFNFDIDANSVYVTNQEPIRMHLKRYRGIECEIHIEEDKRYEIHIDDNEKVVYNRFKEPKTPWAVQFISVRINFNMMI